MQRNARGRSMVFAMCLVVALTSTLRVGTTMRAVDFLQVFASGALFGIGLMGLIQMLRGRGQSAS